MKILAIETSCDETAVCLLEAQDMDSFTVLGNALLSQVDVHKEFGGVYPNLAKREHAKNLAPLLEKVLREADMLREIDSNQLAQPDVENLKKLLKREPELFSRLMLFLAKIERPNIDMIAVTTGPGLEPALWVGINFAKALSHVWSSTLRDEPSGSDSNEDIPVIPVNHMEGHIFASVLQKQATSYKLQAISCPAVALLISGGHTELVKIENWGKYKVLGQTRDDAVGEAFDKVARMMELSYPGGPEISKLAEKAREEGLELEQPLPRPMINTEDCDFSFSGLKTAVLYRLKKIREQNPQVFDISNRIKMKMARAFEDAVCDVLLSKTARALSSSASKTLIIGGGVSANKHIRREFKKFIKDKMPSVELFIPEAALTTDNAIMIAIAGYFNLKNHAALPSSAEIVAEGQRML